MRVLSSIIQIAVLAMLNVRQQRALRHAMAASLSVTSTCGTYCRPLQQPLEEALRSPGSAAILHQDVEHDPVLIDGTPEIMRLALDPDVISSKCHLSPGRGRRRRRLFAKLAPNFKYHRRVLS